MKPYAKQLKDWSRRRARIVAYANAGKSKQWIADKLGMTRQRVSQIVIEEGRKNDPAL